MSMNIGLFGSSSQKSLSIGEGLNSLENSATFHDEDNLNLSPRLDSKTKATVGSASIKSPSGSLGSSGKSLSESFAQFGRKFSIVGMLKNHSIGADLELLSVGEQSEHGHSTAEKLAGGADGGDSTKEAAGNTLHL